MAENPIRLPSLAQEKPANLALAREVLTNELNLAHSDLDGIDRKALLIPPLLVALATFAIPHGQLSSTQFGLLAAAVVLGGGAVLVVLRVAAPGETPIGPNAMEMNLNLDLDAVQFERRVVGSLAESVQRTARLTAEKGKALRSAGWLAALAMLFLVLALVAGGFPLTEHTNPPVPSPSSQPSPATSAPTNTPTPPSPSPSPAPTPSPPPSTAPAPADFGTQTSTRGAPETFGQQWVTKGGPTTPSIERLIEKGG